MVEFDEKWVEAEWKAYCLPKGNMHLMVTEFASECLKKQRMVISGW